MSKLPSLYTAVYDINMTKFILMTCIIWSTHFYKKKYWILIPVLLYLSFKSGPLLVENACTSLRQNIWIYIQARKILSVLFRFPRSLQNGCIWQYVISSYLTNHVLPDTLKPNPAAMAHFNTTKTTIIPILSVCN